MSARRSLAYHLTDDRRALGPRLRSRAARSLRSPLAGIANRLGYDVVARDYYSPIPDLSLIPPAFWDSPSPLTGIEISLDEQLDFVEAALAPFLAEFSPPRDASPDADAFYLHNSTYAEVDAEILYAMVRHERPRTIIELGSGRSTQVIQAGRLANEAQGISSHYCVVDPFPGGAVCALARDTIELHAVSATAFPLERFHSLAPGDLVFVDTTHTVKIGGEVNHIILDILPALPPGVVVHFHDVFLPWPYPQPWVAQARWFWAEQYLLQAFLAFNSSFTPILALHALARRAPDRLARLVPSLRPGVAPGAFWLRRSS